MRPSDAVSGVPRKSTGPQRESCDGGVKNFYFVRNWTCGGEAPERSRSLKGAKRPASVDWEGCDPTGSDAGCSEREVRGPQLRLSAGGHKGVCCTINSRPRRCLVRPDSRPIVSMPAMDEALRLVAEGADRTIHLVPEPGTLEARLTAAPGTGSANSGDRGPSHSLGQHEELDPLRADSSEPDRLRLAGRPGLGGIRRRRAGPAGTGRELQRIIESGPWSGGGAYQGGMLSPKFIPVHKRGPGKYAYKNRIFLLL